MRRRPAFDDLRCVETRPAHAGLFTRVCQLRYTQAGLTSTAFDVPVYPAFVVRGEVGR
jgi:hypothetical protein